jgi:uncharacterized repeat protein (TIGR01451 family)/uncharacterized delta-60 repeat protein
MQISGSLKRHQRALPDAIKLALLLLAGALPLSARAQAPGNDNWPGYTISGDFGTTNGSNVNATSQQGEPSHAGLTPKQSIWYNWTANGDGPVEFDTFNSSCDTVLAVYTGTNLANLSLVVANDDINTTNPENANGRGHPNDPYNNNPYIGPSGVKFNATHGTTYYIAVDGTFKKGTCPPAQGAVTLSWGYNSSGVFRLSRGWYLACDAESARPVGGTYGGSPRGEVITVTRLFGNSGKVLVFFDLQDNTAVEGTDYTFPVPPDNPGTNCLIFEDFETTKSFIVPIIDDFFNGNPQGQIGGSNPGRIGIVNTIPVRQYTVVITNAVLDPLEDPTVLSPPRIETIHAAANCYIMDMDGPVLEDPFSPTLGVTNGVVTFERTRYRVTEGVGTARIFVYRGLPLALDPIFGLIQLPIDTTKNTEIHYFIDDRIWNPEVTHDNYFDLQAGSDYAAPDPNNAAQVGAAQLSLNADFGDGTNLALTHGEINNTVTDGLQVNTFGTIRWNSGGDFVHKSINIPIVNDNLPEFNEDIRVELDRFVGHSQDAEYGYNVGFPTFFVQNGQGQTLYNPPAPGNVTILFDDYPAGALDDSHNRDFDIASDPPNNALPGADNPVYSLVVQSNDNKTVIVGSFGSYDEFPRYGIARLNPDGSCDQSFDPHDGVAVKDPINPAFIGAIALDVSGKYLIGGSFSSYNGVPRYNIARVNTNGLLDMTFNPGLGANDTVWAVAGLANGQVIIAGSFTNVSDSVANYLRLRIARLNPDGTVDPSFDPGPNGPNGTINAVAVNPDGTIYIGGDFTTVNGAARVSVALLNTNGLLLTNFAPFTGPNGPVNALALQPDGRLVVGGAFSHAEFYSRNNIIRYTPNGGIDLSFDPGSGANDLVYTLALQADGGILLGGQFTSVNQTRRVGLARLYPNGEVDTGFLDPAYNEFAGLHKPYFNPFVTPKEFIQAMALQADGNLMIGGTFRYVGGGRFSAQVATNSVAPFDGVGESRAAYRNRNNVARLLGGATVGPGSMNLVSTNYSVNENLGFLYIKVNRGNGTLGQIESTFKLPPRAGVDTIGIAQSGTDYVFNRVNPRYGTSWANTRALSDGIFGTNNISTDLFGNAIQSGLDDITVTIKEIPGYQGDRTALLQLDMPSMSDVFYLGGQNIPLGSALGANHVATMLIQEDFTSPGVIGFTVPNYYVNENGTNAVINLTRTNGSVGTITVRFATTNGTALTGTDYLGVTNTITFRSGQLSTNVSIPIINNPVGTLDKTVSLYLTQPGGSSSSLGLSNAVLTIINNNFVPGHLEFDSATYRTNETAPSALFTVRRLGGSVGTLDVQYYTKGLTAVAGVNYKTNYEYPNLTTLHWDDQDSSPRIISVPLIHDGLVTPNLTFAVALTNASAGPAALANPPTIATNTIINTDFLGQLQFSANPYLVNENGGFATITVVRVGGSAQTISANFNTVDGPFAYQFINYLPTNGTLIFPAGVVSRSFTVPLRNDFAVDPTNFYFGVQLSNNGTNNILGFPSFSLVNILDASFYDQTPGSPDTTFKADPGFNDDVYSIALQPGGQIVAAGNFTVANGLPINHIARLNADGTIDTTFLVNLLGGANDAVRAVISQTDTRMVVGGAFSTFNTVARNGLARLNFDGNVDTGFNPGSGANGTVFAIAETFTGTARRLYVGGGFSSFGPVQYSGIVRLFDDGTVDTGFNAFPGANGTVYAVAVYPTNSPHAGQIVIGGDFTSVNGVGRNRVARLNADGSVDPNFDPTGAGVDNTIRALALQSDGSVLIGGAFTNVQGHAYVRLARLSGFDGSLDTTFNVQGGASDLVYSLTLQQDNRIVVGGAFTTANGVTRNRLTRLMPDGTVDPSINFGSGADNYVGAIAIQPDSKLVVGGGFNLFEGQPHHHLARLYGGSIIGAGDFRFSSPTYTVDEIGTNALITILRTGGTAGNITVHAQTGSGGTAVPGTNYIAVQTNLVFPAGETVESFSIPVMDDLTITPDLTVNLQLNAPLPATASTQPTAVLTIYNDDSVASFDSTVYSAPENAVDGAATISIVRVGSSRFPASVVFNTGTNGTAIPGLNYNPLTNVLVSFLAGQSSQTVTQVVKVPVLHDPAVEGDTTVSLRLSAASGTLLVAPFQATLTVREVDQAPGEFMFSQTNYVVSEAGTNALITVLRTNGSTGIASVNFTTLPGTATLDKYAPTNGTLNFGDGETVKSFKVAIFEENNVEGTESVFLQLTNATGGTSIVTTNPIPLFILDDDVGISFATNSFLNAIYIVSETNSFVNVDIFRLNTTNGTTTVGYATSNLTAVAGRDYSNTVGTITFKPGDSRSSIAVPLVRDPLVTGDLTFTLNLFNPSPGVQLATPTTAFVVINDVDTGVNFADTNSPPVSNAHYYVNRDGTNITITVMRTNANTGVVSVNYSTSDGTAHSPANYTGVGLGTLTFTNGQTSNSFTIAINNTPGVIQGDLDFAVNLSGPQATNGATPPQLLPPSSATVTIVDDFSGFSFSRASYDVNQGTGGGTAIITVQRTGFTNSSVSVDFSTQDGTAIANKDYVPVSGTLVFTNGQTSTNFTVSIKGTTLLQQDKTFIVKLANNTPPATTTLVDPQAAQVIIHNQNGSIVIPAGVALISEQNGNGVIDPGETVRMFFAFRNAGGTNTSPNFTATITNSPGVTPISSPDPLSQVYGVLTPEGPAVSRSFTFTAGAVNGQQIAVTFLLRDGTNAVGTNAGTALFTFTVGTNSSSFSNSAPIIINDVAPATPYPSGIEVTNVVGVVSRATVSFTGFQHGAPSDVSALLAAPAGQNVLLMSHAGDGDAVANVNLTFDDNAANFLPSATQISSGTYKPSAFFAPPIFPGPAPTPPTGGPYTNLLAGFNGGNPVGQWSLYVMDDSPGDSGAISNGWRLNVTVVNPVPANTDLGMAMAGGPNPVVVGSNLTYTLTVTNYGPAGTANGVVVSDTLPAGAAFVRATPGPGNGTATTNGTGLLTWNVGSVSTNSPATLTLIVQPLVTGQLTNVATVSTASSDLNPDNNSASYVDTAVVPTADLAMFLSGSPDPVLLGGTITYTLTVSNLGPATAAAPVVATNGLPPNVAFVSASPGYTFVGNVITFTNLGSILNNSSATATVVLKPLVAGIITNKAGCYTTTTLDPAKANNSTSIKTLVEAMLSSRSGSNLLISWPTDVGTFKLQSATTLNPPNWTDVTAQLPSLVGGTNTITMPLSNGTRFFRLRSGP